MTKPKPTRHIDYLDLPEGFTADILQGWYKAYQPVGSGPTNMARNMCALIEHIAEIKGIHLPPAQGLPKLSRKEKRTRPTPSVDLLEQKVRKFIAEQTCISASAIDPMKTWAEQGLDSLDHIEIIMLIEDEFDIEFSDGEAQDANTLNKLLMYIKERSKHPLVRG